MKRKSHPTGITPIGLAKTGIAPGAIPVLAHPLTVAERIERWFIKPLGKMSGDEGFVALMICLPLIEKIVRFKANALRDENLTFSTGSILTKQLAKFLQLSEEDAELFWQQFRNGMQHRAMVKPIVRYQLDPLWNGAPVTANRPVPPNIPEKSFSINIWKLRNLVVSELQNSGTKIWNDDTCPLPTIFIEFPN